MKIEILTENFKKALSLTERITRKSLSLPVLQNVLISGANNVVELITTNLETTIRFFMLAKTEEPGKALAPASFLTNLFGFIKEDRIILKTKENSLFLSAKGKNHKIQCQNIDDFPIIPKINKEIFFEVPASALLDGLNQVVDLPSISQIRPEIGGVYFAVGKSKLCLVGTDSFRLGEKHITTVLANDSAFDFILPQAAAKDLIFAIQPEDERVVVYYDKNQALFQIFAKNEKTAKVELLARLVEGQYPNYREIIPTKSTTKIRLVKDDLSGAVKEAGLFSGKLMEVKLKTIQAERTLVVSSQSPSLGSGETLVTCVVDGKEEEVVFNFRYLSDGLSKIKSSEVVLELNGSDSPGVLKPVGDLSYLYVLMPIKSQ